MSLDVDGAHVLLGITRTRGDSLGHDAIDFLKLAASERYVESFQIFFDARTLFCAEDGHYVFALGHYPSQCDLGGSCALGAGESFDMPNQVEIASEVFALEARVELTEVVRGDIFGFLELTGQKTAAERAIGDEANAQLANCGEEIVFRIARPQRVFGLEGGDGMYAVGAANGCRGGFRQTQVANLALPDEIGHGADGLLNRRFGIDAVLVIEIDEIDVQALERGIAACPDVFGAAVDTQEFSIRRALVAELGRQHNLITTSLNSLAYQDLILERAVHVGGIEEIDAAVEREVNGGDGFGIVGRAIELRHAHASETQARDFQAETAQGNLVHTNIVDHSLTVVAWLRDGDFGLVLRGLEMAQRHVTQKQVQDDGERHDYRAGEKDVLEAVQQTGTNIREELLHQMHSIGELAKGLDEPVAHLAQTQWIRKELQSGSRSAAGNSGHEVVVITSQQNAAENRDPHGAANGAEKRSRGGSSAHVFARGHVLNCDGVDRLQEAHTHAANYHGNHDIYPACGAVHPSEQ